MIALNVRLKSYTSIHKEAVDYINQRRLYTDSLGFSQEKWESFLKEVFEKFGIDFSFSITENNEFLLIEN